MIGAGGPIARWGLIAPALLVLGAAPAAAAMPRLLWVPLCSVGATHWLAVPLDQERSRRDRDDHAGCAHFNCPRKTKLIREA